MFGHQIKDIEDKTLESSKTANVEQSIHEHVQFDAVHMDAKDDCCLVAVAHDEAQDSVLNHKLPVTACVADSQTKPSCDALAAAHALNFVQAPAVVSADDALDAAVPSHVLSAGFFASELNGCMDGIELIDALAADDGSVRVVDVSACLSDIASAKLCFDVLPRENDAASDITDAKSKLAQEWLNHNMAEISKVMMPKCGETIWNTTQDLGNSFDDAFGVGVASLTSLALNDQAVGLDISTLLSTQEPSAGAADTQNTDAQSLEGNCLASDATTLVTREALISSDDSAAVADDAYAYSDADTDICDADADDALALVEVGSIHLKDGDGAASNHGCDEPVAHAVGECDTLVAVAANEANAVNVANMANVAANESEVLADGAAVAAVKAASEAVSITASSAAVGVSTDVGADTDTDAVEVDCCGVALDVVAVALSHASHEGSDICGLTINGCAKIWSESNSYFFERGSNLGSLETMSVGERLDYLLDSFSYEIDPYSIKALDSAIALVHNRRSMMRSCEESNYVLLKNLGLSDVEIQDLLSVLHLEENYSTGAYLLGVCDDELEFKEALKPYSLDTLITDPEFEKAMLDKLLLWNKADERQLNKNARLQTTINKIYSAMDRRCGGRFKLRDQRFIAEMAIIFLSFAHDISKIRTDLDIRAANGLKYEPYQSLTDFIAETKTPYLLLRHLLGRKDDHHKIGLSYGVDMLARYCYNTEKLVSQLFDIRMEINDFSSPLAEIVIKKGDRGSCCTAATTLSSNAEMLRVMAKESAAMRLRISQLNAILQADIEDNVNLLRDRTFERLIKANPIPELQLNSVADLSTENGTSASSLDGIQARANGASTSSSANAIKEADILAASESKTFTAAAGDADAVDAEAKSKDSSSECLNDGTCADAHADACPDAHADTHDDTGADAISDTDSGSDEAADGNCVFHAPKNFSCLKEMERRQRYGNCLFTNLNKEPQRTICTLSSLMYASALAEYERRIHSVNETYSDIYVSDNTMYISTSSRAHASLLFGMNLLTYQDLQTSLEWDGKLVHEIIVRNGLSFRRGHNYHLTECEGNTVIFRGFTLRVDEQPIYPQLKVRQLANNDTLLNQLVGSIALYIAARHEQQNYLIEHRKMLLRIFELMAALSRRERVRLLARLDDVSYERYKLLERSLIIFESINLVSTQKIAASLHANDPLAKAIEQGPQHLLDLMRKYHVNKQCATEAMAGNASLNSFGTTTTAGNNTANLSSNAANASASGSASANNAANAANSANRANGDRASCSMVEAIEQGCVDAGSLKSAWFELINEYEQRCMGVDIPALVQAFNLERKSIAVNSTEAVVFREVLGLGVAIMIGASHADDDIFKASKRHVVTGGFDYRNMKMRGLSLIELENSHLKDFDPLNLPNYMDYELKPSRMVINGCTLSDVLHSAEHCKQQVIVTFENGSKALNDVLCSRQSKAKKLKKQLEQCPV